MRSSCTILRKGLEQELDWTECWIIPLRKIAMPTSFVVRRLWIKRMFQFDYCTPISIDGQHWLTVIQIEGEDNLAIFSEVRRTNPPPTYVLYIHSVLEYFRKAQLKSGRDRRAVNDVEYLLN